MNSELKRQRFLYLLDESGETCASLARKAGLKSSATLYNFKNARSNTFDIETIERIAPFLNVEPENFWKEKRTYPRESENSKNTLIQQREDIPQTGYIPFPMNVHDLVPLYGAVSASSPEVVHFTEDYMIDKVPRHPALLNVKGGFAMQVCGDSMSPRHRPGDRVYVHPHAIPSVGRDCIVVLEPDGNAMLKTLVGKKGSHWKFSQLSPAKEFSIEESEIRKLYLVVGTAY